MVTRGWGGSTAELFKGTKLPPVESPRDLNLDGTALESSNLLRDEIHLFQHKREMILT